MGWPQKIASLGTVLVLPTALLLGGCGGATVREDGSANRYLDLAGGQIQLHQPLQVEAGQARVFIQQGSVRNGFNYYLPHCSFEIRSVQHPGMTIAPGLFQITRVTHVITQVVQTGQVQVAALRLANVDDGGSPQQFEGYHFRLSSAQQPDVLRLSCYGIHAEIPDLEAPTLREIGEILGPIATLRGPGA